MMQETMEKASQQSVDIDFDTSGADKSIEILDSSVLQENKDDKLCATKGSDGEENKVSRFEIYLMNTKYCIHIINYQLYGFSIV